MPPSGDPVVEAHAAAYDAWAEAFAELTSAMPPALAALGERILARFGEPPSVLDVGCGPGRDMAWFEDRGAAATGVDVSRRMLELARARCDGVLLEMDMRELALPSASFDVVWSIASLLHLPKETAVGVLGEFRRVVKPGGVVVLVVKRGTGERWEQAGAAPRRLFARYEPDELRVALATAGLAVESLEPSTGRSGEQWLHAIAVPARSG